MHETLGYHIVISGYGLWLPGDERGTWSETWDESLGFIEPHKLHPGDPVRQQMSLERQTYPACRLNGAMQQQVKATLRRCQTKSDWKIAALSVESTHTHLLMTFTPRNIDNTIKWLKDQMTKAIHRQTSHQGPVWSKGKWCSHIFDDNIWEHTIRYIQRHNERRGVDPTPDTFVQALMP